MKPRGQPFRRSFDKNQEEETNPAGVIHWRMEGLSCLLDLLGAITQSIYVDTQSINLSRSLECGSELAVRRSSYGLMEHEARHYRLDGAGLAAIKSIKTGKIGGK